MRYHKYLSSMNNEAKICFEKRVSQRDGARGGDFSAEKYAALFEKYIKRSYE
jgi:hypothetical protein